MGVKVEDDWIIGSAGSDKKGFYLGRYKKIRLKKKWKQPK